MQYFKQLLNFYINSSVHVALSVCALALVTLIEFSISTDIVLLLFLFFATISGYNFVKFFGIAKFHHRRLANWLKAIQVFSFFCFVFMCYHGSQLPAQTLVYIACFGVVTFFYAIPFLPKHLFVDNQQNLRSIGGLKVYLIALVWAGVTVLLPVINNAFSVTTTVVLTALQRYIYIIVLMLPFEIRDLQFDSVKLSTIPQKIGIKRTKIIGVLLLVLIVVLEVFKTEKQLIHTLVMLLILLITLLFLLFAKKQQTKYYSAFWVEGIPILWGVILLFLAN
ncbi:hypothetical protein FUA26_09945 [Seonamhaeicola algicola]|uniref:Prenyltransferase n=1 Tax=Seonamhaeicola algicola TaxID=1719036 RepID=A0A5C7ANA7_9FLAO|nr:hypothetical protein [Seonamhaeicola algicola]TXE09801.1 hypothetical protein FUA26_09945 [Seonamhaeicola algicola]